MVLMTNPKKGMSREAIGHGAIEMPKHAGCTKNALGLALGVSGFAIKRNNAITLTFWLLSVLPDA